VEGWTPVRTDDGVWTLRHPLHGQACASSSGAWLEALDRYARPCRLRELGRQRPGQAIRLLDVGTGAALNLAAARSELSGVGARLEALTLEIDRDVLRAACGLPASPPEPGVGLAALRRALLGLAEQGGGLAQLEGQAGAAPATIRLVLGDARETLEREPVACAFDAVFLDPFSPGVAPALWEPPFLAAIAARMAPWAVLSTYTSSARVRRALAGAGLGLGAGPRVGAKAGGTLASLGAVLPPLVPREARRGRPRVQEKDASAG
jgi:hypothetical protein